MSATLTQNTNQAVIPVTVTNNVTKGDYVYQYGTNIGWPKPTTAGAGPTTFLLNPTLQTSYAAPSTARAVTTSPMAEGFTYTGSTIAQNAITTATTSVDASATHGSKSIGLVGGNFVNLFMSAVNTLSAKVFNEAGVQQGATLTLATNCTASGIALNSASVFSGCGMADGGYVVVYKNTSNRIGIVRVNASSAITFGPEILPNSTFATAAEQPMVCATTSGGYLITFTWSSSHIATALYTASNVFATGQGGVAANTFSPGTGFSSQLFATPLCLQNGNLLVLANLAAIDNSYSYYYNSIIVLKFNSTATTVDNSQSSYTSVSTGGALSPLIAVCGSITTPDRWVALVVFDASNQTPVLCTGLSPSGGSVTLTNTTTIQGVMGQTQKQVGIAPQADGNVNVYVWNNSNQLQVAKYSPTGSLVAGSLTLLTTISPVSSQSYSLNVFNTGWKTLVNFTPSTTNIPSFLIHQTETLTNGTTFSSTPYTPSQGYSLIGVAQNTANTGELCWVQTEGTAPLGAGFPSANVAFDYVGSPTNSTAKSAIKGNSGTTSGTSVILKGLK